MTLSGKFDAKIKWDNVSKEPSTMFYIWRKIITDDIYILCQYLHYNNHKEMLKHYLLQSIVISSTRHSRINS
jgi:hypothetical protein